MSGFESQGVYESRDDLKLALVVVYGMSVTSCVPLSGPEAKRALATLVLVVRKRLEHLCLPSRWGGFESHMSLFGAVVSIGQHARLSTW